MGERGDRGIDKASDGNATGRDRKAEEGKNNKWLWKAFRGCVFRSAVRHLCSVSLPLPSAVDSLRPAADLTPALPSDDQFWGALQS